MAKEIDKEIGKDKEELIAVYFRKIKEDRRKGRWRVTNFHEREIEGRIEENEENKGLNDKNASKDQFTYFCWFGFGISFKARREPRGESKQERKERKAKDKEGWIK